VHPNKVKDVAGWLDEAFNPKLCKYRRVLVLSGPAGAGKTAVLTRLAQEYEIEILEYKNPHNLQFSELERKQRALNGRLQPLVMVPERWLKRVACSEWQVANRP